MLTYVDGCDKVTLAVAIILLIASNGTSRTLAVSGVTELLGGSGSTVIKYDVSI